jgi:hypothetical protein
MKLIKYQEFSSLSEALKSENLPMVYESQDQLTIFDWGFKNIEVWVDGKYYGDVEAKLCPQSQKQYFVLASERIYIKRSVMANGFDTKP